MPIALIDADTPVFAAAITAEGEPEWVATSRLDRSIAMLLSNITSDTGGTKDYKLYVSGGVNFRSIVDPQYKANRGASPEHREACKQHLIKQWGAIETDGYEADDAVGCEQTDDTIIVGIDKDLLQIEGKHYSWAIRRLGVVARPAVFQEVSYLEGLRKVFTQALVGDISDNIKGIYKIGPKKAIPILAECTDEKEMYDIVRALYNDDERFHNNMDLLWIWRNYGMTYTARREYNG